MKMIKCSAIHDITAPASDKLNGCWHKGFRIEGSETVAFYHAKGWFASVAGIVACLGPFASKMEAAKGGAK